MFYYRYLISVHCREITVDFFEKVRRCATAYGMFYACECSLDIAIAYRKNFNSHQQSPRVVYREFFVAKFKKEETDHIPGDYLVTYFSFGRFIRQENPSYRLLKSGNNVTVIFTKFTWYCTYLNKEICMRVKR